MVSRVPLRVANEAGLSVEVTGGRFKIADARLGWTFGGRAADRITDADTRRGRDSAGAYREIVFAFTRANSAARRGAIRLYERRAIVLFELTFADSGDTGETFPALSEYPSGLRHLAYTGTFGRYSFSRFGTDGPWAFFDDKANSFILSAAAHFMNSALSRGPRSQLRSGLAAIEKKIPAGYVHRTVLAVEPGINRAFETWGNFLTDLAGKKRPRNDAGAELKYLGYWTDHGARYYYKTAPGLDYPATLLRVRDEFAKAKLGLGYFQLDSWFYRKGRKGKWRSTDSFGGGTYRYEAAPEIFPKGLRAFQARLGLPLVTHNRWIDERSPYRRQYEISGNVATDPALWREWMRYLRRSGVRTYEQDWLSKQAAPQRNLADGERFMDMMAEAARREGIALQYCMALPRHFLQGTKYANLTTIRPSGDRLRPHHWKSFLFNGRLATALGEWPWTDVFKSSETAHLLLATLSGGMVGVGDTLGKFDWDNLRRAVRRDGVIVKPDRPLTPLDATYLSQAKDKRAAIVAAASTDHDGRLTSYVLSFGKRPASLSGAALGHDGPIYVYDYFRKTGVSLAATKTMSLRVFDFGVSYKIIVPVGPSGIAFLGDADKFVSNGKQRIPRIADNGMLTARVALAPGEDRVRLFGYSRSRPKFRIRGGTVQSLNYDLLSRQFLIEIAAKSTTLELTAQGAT